MGGLFGLFCLFLKIWLIHLAIDSSISVLYVGFVATFG
jgi:hypothetical protein